MAKNVPEGARAGINQPRSRGESALSSMPENRKERPGLKIVDKRGYSIWGQHKANVRRVETACAKHRK
jgi:hypothetical protein